MDTSESAFESLMARASELPELSWSGAGDLGRRSVEAMIAKQWGDARELLSRGLLRLHGSGVQGHSAPLASVGQVAGNWQRAVSAVGASLEGSKTVQGRLSESIVQRTTLMLEAAPAPGSVLLQIAPRVDPFIEVAPKGQRSLLESHRPLADRANEALIGLLSQAAGTGPDGSDLAEHFRELGARVASTVKLLASSVSAANFDLDVSWFEPSHPAARASLTASAASWLAEFVDGAALDSFEDVLVGVAHTLSDVARWRIDTEDGSRFVDITQLTPDEIGNPRVGETVSLRVRVQPVERPDGTSSESYIALELLDSPSG